MKESKVLIINLSSTCNELARHLVLSGINLELLDIADLLV
jgi:molybdopterin/thiamine biosynthesis adenylyltransferase